MNQGHFLTALREIRDRLASLAFSIGGDQKDYTCRIFLTGAQNINSGAWTKILLDTKSHDPVAMFDSANKRINILESGYYQVNGAMQTGSRGAGSYSVCALYKNGVQVRQGSNAGNIPATSVPNSVFSDVLYLEKGDYLELYGYQDGGTTNLQSVAANVPYCLLTVAKLNKYAPGSSQPNGEAWQTVNSLLNGWVVYSSAFPPVQYFKDPFGVVHLHGLVKSGSVGAGLPIFVLPQGYRPTWQEHFSVPSLSAYGQVEILPNGNVICAVGSATWLSLNGISFRADGY